MLFYIFEQDDISGTYTQFVADVAADRTRNDPSTHCCDELLETVCIFKNQLIEQQHQMLVHPSLEMRTLAIADVHRYRLDRTSVLKCLERYLDDELIAPKHSSNKYDTKVPSLYLTHT